ncbi:MAG: hypothetical protein IJA82_06765 [Clostridia bacterium]|nr:hypothetical protein [Clostridia bacterium]
MRKLTIKRKWSFVACAGTAKVYIEDHSSSEMTITGVPVRKLGKLKNGKEVSFDIPEGELKVFVIFDALSKEYCNDIYKISAEGDVSLTGKCKFNLGTGNAFRFDNNNTVDASINRKKGSIIGWIAMAVAIIIGAVVGWYLSEIIVNML